jgi:hypothetical protein
MKGGEKQNYLFGPPISRRAGEGEMEAGRGKKSKKWQLTLGVKDAVFAAFGIIGLLMMSFTLGALAGRGDIYRVAYSWGLLRPQANPMAQVIPQVALAPVPSVAGAPAAPAVPNSEAAAVPAPVAARRAGARPRLPVQVKGKVAAKSEHAAPIAASVAALPAPAAVAPARKKSKAALARHERKVKEEQERKERLEMAKKLSFLNSLDSTPKFGQKNKTKATTAKPQPPVLIRVATCRDSKSAHAKMAELEKQGVKATVKQRKGAKGVVSYVVYRQVQSQAKETEKVAENKEKRHSPAPGHKTQTH